ncbi:hypothetical protein BGX31_002989 [Mortierella sp. GBA43]|nr:hypothetical protein BGX31_002989 [Mortierella sp. GBA43]
MIKHSKLTTSGSKRRGSASLTQGSLTSLLWSKLVSSQENITMNSSDISDNDSTADTLINQDTSMIDYRSTGGLVIAPTNGNTSANSGKKRWSLFSYGAKDEEYEGAPTAKLRKRGDVLIEPESRPESTKEIVTEAPETKSTGQSSFIDGPNPPSESTQPIAAMRTELADPLAEQGATAPALVGTSEASVVVTSGTVSQSKSESTRAPNSSSPAPSTYSWLSIIPGYSNKTDSSSPPTSQPLGNPHLAENQEIRSMDLDENKGLPSGASGAELTEVKSSKEVIVVKGGSKEDRKSGLTSAQIKGRQSQKSIVGEAGKAMDSLSKIVLRKKNVVLPNYYDQYPDVRQSLIALPASIADGSPRGPRHERSSSIMKSAVNAISSLLFSKATPEQPASTTTENSLQNTRSVRRVVIIGVHGWFPVKLIRTVIGEPTGTSQKFCEEMDLALKEYLRIHNVELEPGAVTLIPLEGEGKVMNRVDILHRNLVSNGQWKRALDDADLVLVATHSQGTPTSTLLIARLINEGLLRVQENDPRMHRVGILAMAGISHGPFPYLKGNLIVRWFEADAAQELFEFMDSESDISKRYREALRTVLTSGIRFTVVASLEDQVVPLYSAIMTSIHHPSIVRAVYIDGASYQDDFLTNLISFSLRLRNSGVDDHGVLVHLSEAVAGSIYGEGHSTIYAEREVYMLAIRALLEPPKNLTTEMIRSEPVLHPFRAMQNLNPFYLPWGMRGVMDELQSLGSEALSREMEHLRKLYDEWNPVSKAMKEIKFRLEPVRSKL